MTSLLGPVTALLAVALVLAIADEGVVDDATTGVSSRVLAVILAVESCSFAISTRKPSDDKQDLPQLYYYHPVSLISHYFLHPLHHRLKQVMLFSLPLHVDMPISSNQDVEQDVVQRDHEQEQVELRRVSLR
jgi:hypothetical protein